MATEKQIAANRANAKRSTGPKTAAGRAKSSRNAYRHGLSCDLPLEDLALRVRVNSIAEALLADQASTEENMIAAAEFARGASEAIGNPQGAAGNADRASTAKSQSAGLFAASRIGPLRATGAHQEAPRILQALPTTKVSGTFAGKNALN